MMTPIDTRQLHLETAQGEWLDRIALCFDLYRRHETDVMLRERIRRRMQFNVASTGYIAGELDGLLDEIKPYWVSFEQAHHELAIYWLRQERPRTFWARVRWCWRVCRALWTR